MRRYELMAILDPAIDERTANAALDPYLKVVKDGGGSVEKVDVWAAAPGVRHPEEVRRHLRGGRPVG